MAQKNLTRLNVALTLTTGAFSRSTSAAIKTAEALGNSIKSSLLSPFGALSAALSGGALIAGFKGTADSIDALAKSADRLAISTESMAGLRQAAQEGGVGVDLLEQAMTKLQVKVQQAIGGNIAAASTFQALGLSVQGLGSVGADKQLEMVSDRILAMGTASQRANAAVMLFGETGQKLSSVLSLGSDGFKKTRDTAESMGVSVSRIDAAKVEEMNKSIVRLGNSASGAATKIVTEFAPSIYAISELTSRSIKNGGVIQAHIKGLSDSMETFLAVVASAWEGVYTFARVCRVAIGGVGTIVYSLLETASRTFDGMQSAALFAAETIKMAFTSPWQAIKVAFFGTLKVINDFFGATIEQIGETINRLGNSISGMSETAGNSIKKVGGWIKDLSLAQKQNSDTLDFAIQKNNDLGKSYDQLSGPILSMTSWFKFAADSTSDFAREAGQEIRNIFASGFWGDEILKAIGQSKAALNDIATNAANVAGTMAKTVAVASSSMYDSMKLSWENVQRVASSAYDNLGKWHIKYTEDIKRREFDAATLMMNLMLSKAELNKSLMAEQSAAHAEYLATAQAREQAHELSIERTRIDALERQRQNTNVSEADVAADREVYRADYMQQEHDTATRNAAMWADGYRGKAQVASQFFGTLQQLQQSNDKKMRAIGEAAARAKIVTDTATAAMGAFSSLASIPFVGYGMGVAAAAATVAAGAIQLGNVGKSTISDGGGTPPAMPDTAASSNVGGPAARAGQTLILQGDTFSAESLQRMFADAKEKGYVIEGVRRE